MAQVEQQPDEPVLLELTGDLGAHDPVIIKAGDTYYRFQTGGRRGRNSIPMFTSPDMLAWTRAGAVFEELPAWVADEVPEARNCWAPDIYFMNDQYYLYYSLSSFGVNHSAIGLATNATLNPDDPGYAWVDRGLVVRSRPGETDFNAIDPNLIVTSAGEAWLDWGSFWGGIMLMRVDAQTGLPTDDDREVYALASRPRDGEHQTPPIEGAIEAPFIVERDGWFYLFLSWDFCCRGADSTYKVVVGRSREVTGPYVDKVGKPMAEGGGTVILSSDAGDWRGPGHPSVYHEDGRDYLVFHAYSAENGRPRLHISTIVWEDGWPRVATLQ